MLLHIKFDYAMEKYVNCLKTIHIDKLLKLNIFIIWLSGTVELSNRVTTVFKDRTTDK